MNVGRNVTFRRYYKRRSKRGKLVGHTLVKGTAGVVTATFDDGNQIIVEYEGKEGPTRHAFILKKGEKQWTNVLTSRKYVIEE